MNKAAEKLDNLSLRQCQGHSILELYGLKDTPSLKALCSGQPVNNIAFRYNISGVELFQICNARPIFKGNEVVASYTI